MKTFASIFGGCGGSDRGAEQAGLSPVWTVEMDADVAGVHKMNFEARAIIAKAEDVDYSALESPWWLHVSPVCKNASVAKADGEEGAEDVTMAEACARAIGQCGAAQISLENVWGYRNFESFRIILRALEANGYAFDYWHLNAADYGVPQTRKRLILLASKTHRPQRPQPTHRERADMFLPKWVGWYEAIEDLIPTLPESKFAAWQLKRLPEMFATTLITEQYDLSSSYGEARAPQRIEPAAPSPTILAEHGGKFRAFILEGAVAGMRPPTARYADGPCFTYTANNGSGRYNPTRAFLVGGANTSETQAAEGVGVSDAGEPSRCVNASNSTHWRAWLEQGRVVSMTPRALARFQSFPDDFRLPEKSSLACRVIGNAVPPLLMRRVIESHAEAVSRRAA